MNGSKPDDLLWGKCAVCGSEITCDRSQCRELADGFAGKATFAECPGQRVVNGKPRPCGSRVQMIKRERQE